MSDMKKILHLGFLSDTKNLKQNITVNFLGQGWSVLMGFAFVPLYIRFLGAEAYGVIGMYAILYGLLNLFDFGMTATINRELAQYSVQPEKSKEMRDLVRTLEVVYWTIGLFLSIGIAFLSPFIAFDWLNAQQISAEIIRQSVLMMAILAFFQWPLSLYQGGLIGLEKQIQLNLLNIMMSTIRSGGSALILWVVSPTLGAFFLWQIIVSMAQIIIIRFLLWNYLPKGIHPPLFQIQLVRKVWRFAAGIGVTSLMALLRSQVDKIAVSKLVSLELFGYYVLASNLGLALSMLSAPIFSASFPRLSVLVKQMKQDEIQILYHRLCQLVAIITIPPGLVLSLFSYEILLLWTWDPNIAKIGAPVLTVIGFGTLLNSLVGMPYDLQIAYGWTRLAVYKSIIGFIILIPAMYFFTFYFGIVGAGFTWLILNLGYLFIEVPIMHRRLLKGQMAYWYIYDVGIPLLVSFIVVALIRWVVPLLSLSMTTFVFLLAVFAVALTTTCLSIPLSRNWLFSRRSLNKI